MAVFLVRQAQLALEIAIQSSRQSARTELNGGQFSFACGVLGEGERDEEQGGCGVEAGCRGRGFRC